jgi:hypothetical protein
MMHTRKSADLLRLISNEMAKEKETNRFYALQWLWDWVSIYSKNGWVELTLDQLSIVEGNLSEDSR